MALASMFNPLRAPSVAAMVEQEAEQARRERLEAMRRALAAYEGELPKPLAVASGTPDDNVIGNLCRLFVDKGVSFLFGAMPETSIDGDDTQAQEALEAFWDANAGPSLLQDAAINGGWAGHVFLRLSKPRREGEPPRLTVMDPLTVDARWALDDLQDIYQWIITWHGINRQGSGAARRQTIERVPSGQAWLIVDEESIRDGQWGEIGRELWPFPWPPIHHCQNLPRPNEVFGFPDLTDDIVAVQTAVNRTLSNVGRILRFHAHPKTVAIGVGPKGLDVSVDNVICLEAQGSDLKNLEMQSDLSSSLEYHRRLSEALHAMARVPEVATGRTEDLGALSGVALRILYQPLIEKTSVKQLRYGEMLRQLCEHVLEMQGIAGQKVTINWPEPLPTDDKAEAETLQLHEALGASKATLLAKLGYDAQEELRQSDEEAKAAFANEAQFGGAMLGQWERGQVARGSAQPGNNAQTGAK